MPTMRLVNGNFMLEARVQLSNFSVLTNATFARKPVQATLAVEGLVRPASDRPGWKG